MCVLAFEGLGISAAVRYCQQVAGFEAGANCNRQPLMNGEQEPRSCIRMKVGTNGQIICHRRGNEGDYRRRPDTWRVWLYQGLPSKAPDERIQIASDNRRNQSDPESGYFTAAAGGNPNLAVEGQFVSGHMGNHF